MARQQDPSSVQGMSLPLTLKDPVRGSDAGRLATGSSRMLCSSMNPSTCARIASRSAAARR